MEFRYSDRILFRSNRKKSSSCENSDTTDNTRNIIMPPADQRFFIYYTNLNPYQQCFIEKRLLQEQKSNAFLNKDELIQLTGLVNVSSQHKWLADNEWIYIVSAKGTSVADREYGHIKMSGGETRNDRSGQMPDFSKVA